MAETTNNNIDKLCILQTQSASLILNSTFYTPSYLNSYFRLDWL